MSYSWHGWLEGVIAMLTDVSWFIIIFSIGVVVRSREQW
jgi:hypothetical protein